MKQIGPNVSISANARIGVGVRLVTALFLMMLNSSGNALVIHAIVGWNSSIGRWSRVR
ncbi:hypothetical protein DH2020_041546 [Rehmannia glutinosa]|uniref:Mannose-1-phosphate guanyltransferase C-terminal domain-containing protein n=1 Tax=Rehmannia glutinosa TaxID=99300 RepID=A0ABR0UPV9_REHGL